jgi:hypothetical protein
MRTLILGGALMLAGCASLDSDLTAADARCTQGSAMTAFVTCLNQAEEPVWQKEAPASLAGYRSFAAARMALAADLDSGKITAAEFKDGAAAARAKFSTALAQNARAAQEQAQAQAAQDALQQMQQQQPTEMDGRNSMGGMNNM